MTCISLFSGSKHYYYYYYYYYYGSWFELLVARMFCCATAGLKLLNAPHVFDPGFRVQEVVKVLGLPVGSIVVPFCGWYLGSYKVNPKRNYLGACG